MIKTQPRPPSYEPEKSLWSHLSSDDEIGFMFLVPPVASALVANNPMRAKAIKSDIEVDCAMFSYVLGRKSKRHRSIQKMLFKRYEAAKKRTAGRLTPSIKT